MIFTKWLPELVRRVKDDRTFARYDMESARYADALEKELTPKQMKTLGKYLDCIEGMALTRMIHAYNLGLEHGREENRQRSF